jgi:hypothetical protein
MTVPDWLKIRDGGLVKGLNDRTWLVGTGGAPNYRIEVLPAKGQFTCAILQTNNGKRLDEGKVYPTSDAALAGGLEELRGKLGW